MPGESEQFMKRKKLPEFEQWKAPWEESGEEFDAAKAKKFIYNLTSDRNEAEAQAAAAETRVTELQGEVSSGDKDARSEIDRLKTQLAEATGNVAEHKLSSARLRVALAKGLTEKQANRLVGTTFDELSSDADSYLEELKGKSKGEDEDGDDEGEDEDGGDDRYDEDGDKGTGSDSGKDSGRGKGRLRSGFGGADNDMGTFDPDKLADLIPRGY